MTWMFTLLPYSCVEVLMPKGDGSRRREELTKVMGVTRSGEGLGGPSSPFTLWGPSGKSCDSEGSPRPLRGHPDLGLPGPRTVRKRRLFVWHRWKHKATLRSRGQKSPCFGRSLLTMESQLQSQESKGIHVPVLYFLTLVLVSTLYLPHRV